MSSTSKPSSPSSSPIPAASYPSGHHSSVLRSHTSRTATNSCAYLLPHLTSPSLHILDIGCGPGTITTSLAALVPTGHVTGVDTSPDVIVHARTLAAQTDIPSGRVTFTEGSIHALPFDDAVFDVVHVHQVLQHCGSPVAALREMRRVTKPGGIIAAREADFGAMTWFPEEEEEEESEGDDGKGEGKQVLKGLRAWRALWMKVARASGGEPNAGRRLHAWAHEAGFGWEEILRSVGTWLYSSPEEREWWSSMHADRLLESKFRQSAIEGGHVQLAELQELAQTWREWGTKEDGWFAVLHGEIVCRVSDLRSNGGR